MSFEEQMKKIQEYISSNPEEKPIVLSELNLIIRQHDKTFNLPTIILTYSFLRFATNVLY